MLLYELRKWLNKIYEGNDFQGEICTTHIDHIRKLLILREHPELVASDLLYASIELVHVDGGEAALLEHAKYLRSMATTIERRVKRTKIKTTPKATEPVNQA
jgi:hypothetical protein